MERSSVVGHARQIAQLENDLATGNVAHAYLFVGPDRVGKSTVARWFATELLTRGLEPSAKSAAERQIERLIHPDFLSLDQLWIEDVSENLDEIALSSNVPQSHRWKAPAMRSDAISIDDVRVIQEKIVETGAGPRRACFIRGVDRLQDAAANALLKTLEEPPEGRTFLLTAATDSALLPTIVSRSRVLRFDRVPDADIAPLVRSVPADDRPFVLHLAQGAPGSAIALAEDPDVLRDERVMHAQATSFWGPMSTSERLKALAPITDKGGDAERFLLHLAVALRESPSRSVARTNAFLRLVRRLETNAYKPLIAQEFVLSIA